MRSVGAVFVRSARWPRVRLPAATASARYTPYEPECVPITLRWLRLVVEPTTGPRSTAGGGAPANRERAAGRAGLARMRRETDVLLRRPAGCGVSSHVRCATMAGGGAIRPLALRTFAHHEHRM